MSKSVFIKSNIKIEKKTFINLIKEFFIKEDSYDNLLILQFKKKNGYGYFLMKVEST